MIYSLYNSKIIFHIFFIFNIISYIKFTAFCAVLNTKKRIAHYELSAYFFGDPGGIRTPDPRLRRPLLYPTELLNHVDYLYM